jgi:hypothetical protein
MKIKSDTAKYQKLLGDKRLQSLGLLKKTDLSTFDDDAYILTGDKTKDFGGGPSPYGFVILKDKVVGRVKLADAK